MNSQDKKLQCSYLHENEDDEEYDHVSLLPSTNLLDQKNNQIIESKFKKASLDLKKASKTS